MSPEVRSVIRKIDELVIRGEFNDAYNQGILKIQESDQSREYEDSISVLNKLIEHAVSLEETVLKENLLVHLMIRHLLRGQLDMAINIRKTLRKEFTVPLAEFAKSIIDAQITNKDTNFVLESIEKQTIFGEFEQEKNIPFIKISKEDEVTRILEEFFSNGRYIVNLINTENSLLHSINIDIGSAQEINVVENRRIFRIKG